MPSFQRFARSHNTERALSSPRPRLRGISHRVAAIVSVPAGVWLVLSAAAGTPRLAAAVFAITVTFMFSASALVHYRTWDPHTTEVLFRLDHTAIYLVIAGTATPIGLLAMSGTWQVVFLVGVWVGAVAGVVIEWLPPATPRGLAHTLYLVLGWAAVPMLPQVLDHRGWGAVVLLLVGGLFYTVGAVIVALRRPDPAPHVLGYHEIWHLLVIAAVAVHYLMIRVTLLPPA